MMLNIRAADVFAATALILPPWRHAMADGDAFRRRHAPICCRAMLLIIMSTLSFSPFRHCRPLFSPPRLLFHYSLPPLRDIDDTLISAAIFAIFSPFRYAACPPLIRRFHAAAASLLLPLLYYASAEATRCRAAAMPPLPLIFSIFAAITPLRHYDFRHRFATPLSLR